MPQVLRKRKVVLHGHLGEQFGKSFDLAVRSPGAAVRLLEANFPKRFSEALAQGRYHIVVGEMHYGVHCNDNDINFNYPDGVIHFVPETIGAGKGWMMAILGISILAIAFTGGLAAGGLFAGGITGLGAGGGIAAGMGTAIFGGVTWGQVALLGTAVLLSGVSILLTPSVKAPEETATSDAKSYFFNGAVNVSKEGTCVPLVYGRVIAGSVVVSAGLSTVKLDATTNTTTGTGGALASLLGLAQYGSKALGLSSNAQANPV